MVRERGGRTTLLVGYLFCLLGFITMLWLWDAGISYGPVALAYAFVGLGTNQESIAEGQAAFASGRRIEWRTR